MADDLEGPDHLFDARRATGTDLPQIKRGVPPFARASAFVGARIHLTRDSGFTDFARRYDIVINGEVVGGVRNGGVFECDIPSGRTLVQLRVDWCGSNTVEFEAPEGGVVHLECGSNLRGWKILQTRKVMRESPNEWIWLKQVDRVGRHFS